MRRARALHTVVAIEGKKITAYILKEIIDNTSSTKQKAGLKKAQERLNNMDKKDGK